ncbi:MAG: helix-turn-helix domain-containing protein [Pseudomonadota bacterium]
MPDHDIAAVKQIAKPTFDDDRQLTPKEVSEMVGLSVTTLRDYRSTRGLHYGLPFHKDGRRVFYRLSEVLTWMDARVTHHGGHYNG